MKELMNEGFQSIKDELSKISQSLSLILSHKSPDNSSVKKTDAWTLNIYVIVKIIKNI